MPNDTSVELTKAIISALPAAALAVLFAIFAVIIVVIFIRQQSAMFASFTASLREEGERNRAAGCEQALRWRDDFSAGMSRFAGEMGQVNANVLSLTQALGNHDRTMQIGIAGMTNAIQAVSKSATGPLTQK